MITARAILILMTTNAMHQAEYKRVMRMKFVRLGFSACANCDEKTLYRNVETNEVRCIECSYVQQTAQVTRASVSVSECNYDAKSIAARIIARAKAR